MSEVVSTKNRMSVNTIAKVSVLGALAFLVMIFQVPLPFAPGFYQLDFSEVIVLIGGFALGPWAAVVIEALKITLDLLFQGSATWGVGELSNFIIGCSLVVPAAILYRRNKTRKNALIGLILGIILMTFIGAFSNYFIVLPAYTLFMNLPIENIIEMGHVINPNINGLFSLVLLATVPFNLLKGIVVSSIAFTFYKKVSPIIKKQ